MKVELEIPKRVIKNGIRLHEGSRMWRHGHCLYWRKSLPFLLNPRGVLIHRVRSADTVFWDGKPHHDTAHYWCGNMGRGEFLAVPPADRLVCAICEQRAVAAGKPSSDELVGHHVHIGTLKAHRLCCRNDEN